MSSFSIEFKAYCGGKRIKSPSDKHFYLDSNFELSPPLHIASMQPSRSYNHETSAEALFFKNIVNGSVHQAIRVEVPELGIEFTDNAYIGKGEFSSDYK